MSYLSEYRRSIEEPEVFWAEKAAELPWFQPASRVVSKDGNGMCRWFADGELNTSFMALDHHVEQGRGDALALIYDSPVTGVQQRWTYRELLDRVSRFAGALQGCGVGYGDRVVIYMPMVPEAVIAMLASARIGAIHSVVFGGFAPHELALRIDDATPKVIVTASCGIEIQKVIEYKPLVDEALELSTHRPDSCIVLQRPQAEASMIIGRDVDFQQVMESAEPVASVPVKGSDPLYVLYTSGTTGKPKGIVREHGGHAVALKYSMQAVYGMGPGDVFWAASDVGWVVGHSYIVYGPLLAGCTTLLYEGKPVRTPDAGAFWRVVEEHGVHALFAAPTAFRAIKKEDSGARLLAKHDLSSLRTIFMAGERLDPPTYDWTLEKTGKPVVDHWWQTETGWAICANPIGMESLPTKPGSATVPVPGYEVSILGADGQELPPNDEGAIAIKLPLPPGCAPTIWGDFERYESSYLSTYPGYYMSGDGGYKDEDGYVYVMGRIDDVINVAGHRLSTGEIEEAVAGHSAVAECAVIGIADDLKGQVPIGLVVMKDGTDMSASQLEEELVARVRRKVSAIACFHRAVTVQRLPKTRSGKILRRTLRRIADGLTYDVPSTIDDPAVLSEVEEVLRRDGIVGSDL